MAVNNILVVNLFFLNNHQPLPHIQQFQHKKFRQKSIKLIVSTSVCQLIKFCYNTKQYDTYFSGIASTVGRGSSAILGVRKDTNKVLFHNIAVLGAGLACFFNVFSTTYPLMIVFAVVFTFFFGNILLVEQNLYSLSLSIYIYICACVLIILIAEMVVFSLNSIVRLVSVIKTFIKCICVILMNQDEMIAT